MADVFISYARKDREAALTLATALEATGYSVWWDPEILGGENFDDAIERELDLAGAAIVLWSRHSVSSNWVRSEAAAAAERGIIIPAFIEAIKLPIEFRRKHTIDLSSWQGGSGAHEFKQLCQAIDAHLQAPRSPQSSPAAKLSATPNKHKEVHFYSAPVSILRASIAAVPAVKYALGIAGIGAALAISSTFFTSTSAALTGIGLMLPLMVLLAIFAAIAGLGKKELRSPALAFTWAILLIFIGSVSLFVSSIFFNWPKPTEELLKLRPSISEPSPDKTEELIINGNFDQVNTAGSLYGWDLNKWNGIGEGAIDRTIFYTRPSSARVSSTAPAHVRWAQAVKVKKDTTYFLTAMMKADRVTHSENRNYILGANIGVLGLTDHGEEIIKYSEAVLGTTGWQKETVRFDTGPNERILVVLELGGYSATAHGTVWFDDVHLKAEEVSAQQASRIAASL